MSHLQAAGSGAVRVDELEALVMDRQIREFLEDPKPGDLFVKFREKAIKFFNMCDYANAYIVYRRLFICLNGLKTCNAYIEEIEQEKQHCQERIDFCLRAIDQSCLIESNSESDVNESINEIVKLADNNDEPGKKMLSNGSEQEALKFKTFHYIFKEFGNYPLENNDNCCYLNSSLQCLINLPRFIYECLNVPNLLPDIGKKSILLRVLYENFRNIVLKQEYFRGFVRELKFHLNDFNNYHQQDSHEFLSFILDKIHDEEKLYYPKSSFPAISSLFLVDIEKRILCPKRHASISHDKTHILTLHLMNNNDCNLSELIAENIGKEEIIEGYRCDKCNANCDAMIEQEIVRYPLYFIIHINRAVTFFGNVVRVSVTAPEVISFEGSKHLYRLNGIINHNGWQDFGHYTAVCRKISSGNWVLYNDETIIEDYDITVLSKASQYIFFYEKIGTDVETDH